MNFLLGNRWDGQNYVTFESKIDYEIVVDNAFPYKILLQMKNWQWKSWFVSGECWPLMTLMSSCYYQVLYINKTNNFVKKPYFQYQYLRYVTLSVILVVTNTIGLVKSL